MRAVKEDQDYYVFLTREEILKLGTRSATWPKYYPYMFSKVFDRLENKMTEEILAISCTRNAFILSDEEKTHDNIYFELEEEGPTIKVYPPTLALVLERGYIVTRYNAEAKVWIQLDT